MSFTLIQIGFYTTHQSLLTESHKKSQKHLQIGIPSLISSFNPQTLPMTLLGIKGKE